MKLKTEETSSQWQELATVGFGDKVTFQEGFGGKV